MANELSPEDREKLSQEIKTLRTEIELIAKDLGDRFASLERTVAARVTIPRAELERLSKVTEEVEAFRERLAITTKAIAEGVPLGMAWRRTYEEKLWADRTARGEVEITESFVSERNKFAVLHHKPSCETTVVVEPIP